MRVFVVDDHPAVRAGLQDLLAAEPDLDPVGAAGAAADAADAVREVCPQVAIVDYRLPGRDGLTLTIQLKRLTRPPAVVLYSAFADARLVVAGIVAGADAIVRKSGSPQQLCAAVRAVAAGVRAGPEICPHVMREIVAELPAEDKPILDMLIDGMALSAIADVLDMSTEWLTIRRWAIVRQVVSGGRRSG